MKCKCVMCGAIRETLQPAKTCSIKCRTAYSRYKKKGGVEIECEITDQPMKAASNHVVPYWLFNGRKRGFIYLIRELDITGYCKIGMTASWHERKRVFGIQLPFRWEMLHLFETANMQEAEMRLHVMFAEKQARGEWFDLSDEDIDYIKSIESE